MTVIGVTGGIASGKSTLVSMLAREGCCVVDSDVIVHRLLLKRTRVHARVRKVFGADYLDAHGELDRRKLGRLVFADRVARRRLEGIIHPAVFAEIRRQIRAFRARGCRCVVVDIPLLFETHAERLVDTIAVAYAPRSVQMRRLSARGLARTDALRRIRAQWSLDAKRRRADVVFDMRKTMSQIQREVRQWIRKVQSTTME